MSAVADPPARTDLGRVAARGAGVTLAGQGARILLQLASVVGLARLLGPADYGLLAVGLVVMATVLSGLDAFGRGWSIHTLMGGSLLTIIGVQVVSLGLCAHAYGMYFMGDVDPWFDRLPRMPREDAVRWA